MREPLARTETGDKADDERKVRWADTREQRKGLTFSGFFALGRLVRHVGDWGDVIPD